MRYLFNGSNSQTRTWKKAFIIISSSALGLYLVFMMLYFVTSEPSFCATCHQVKPYVTSWQNSPHKEVKCLFCHEPRGFLGKLHSKSRGLNYLYQQWTGQYSIIAEAVIFEQNCIGCHLGDYENYPKAKRMDLEHYDYIKEDKSCLECHRSVGHKVNLFYKAKFTK